MDKLLVKVQYKDYETGEFSDIKLRTASETIELIKQYPWNEQRHLFSVGLTCPSVTIEQAAGSFLKIGPYFNGKFCLYYFNKATQVSYKAIKDLADSFEAVVDFYNEKIPAADLEKSAWTRNPKKHFTTATFAYTVTRKRILTYVLYPAILLVLFPLLLFTQGFTNWQMFTNLYGLALLVGILMLLNGGNVYLFFNYYFYSRNLYLQLSKGHPTFFFGTKEVYRKYSKADIKVAKFFNHQGTKNLWSDNYVFEITFTNGEVIRFPSLLIDATLLQDKLPEQVIEMKHKFFATI
jgi:hypothetical protein